MMDNVGSTSPVRPAPAAPPQPSPPLFMSALSKLHGGASAAELQVPPISFLLLSQFVTCCQMREEKRRAFVEGLNAQVIQTAICFGLCMLSVNPQVISKHAAAGEDVRGRSRKLQNVVPP
jgi:hypothetical protein